MNHSEPRLVGLHITLRHQMIVVAFSAVMLATITRVIDAPDSQVTQRLIQALLLVSPWVLGTLILLMDRPGPVKQWLVALVFFAFCPAFVIYQDIMLATTLNESGRWHGFALTAIMNVLIAIASVIFYTRMRPFDCPKCSKHTLIPLLRIAGQSYRFQKTRWCASCGGQYWRDQSRAWRIERRQTWVQGPLAMAIPTQPAAESPIVSKPPHFGNTTKDVTNSRPSA